MSKCMVCNTDWEVLQARIDELERELKTANKERDELNEELEASLRARMGNKLYEKSMDALMGRGTRGKR